MARPAPEVRDAEESRAHARGGREEAARRGAERREGFAKDALAATGNLRERAFLPHRTIMNYLKVFVNMIEIVFVNHLSLIIRRAALTIEYGRPLPVWCKRSSLLGQPMQPGCAASSSGTPWRNSPAANVALSDSRRLCA